MNTSGMDGGGGETRASLVSPHPLMQFLPAIYGQRPEGPDVKLLPALLESWDEWLAPVFVSLDSLEAYFDPKLAPPAFIDWLGRWVGLEPTQRWPLGHRRARISNAVQLFLWWGTKLGIAHYVATFTGISVERIEVLDTGGVDVSLEPNVDLSWTSEARLVVRVTVEDQDSVDLDRLNDIVAAAKPAHVLHNVEVRG
jgi:phage tail-like protein